MGEQYYLNIMLELEADASTTEMPKIVNETDNGGRTNALRRSKYPRSGICYHGYLSKSFIAYSGFEMVSKEPILYFKNLHL